MDIGILVLLILFNGVFAMSEIALVTAKPSRLQKLADEGNRAAMRASSWEKTQRSFFPPCKLVSR